MPEQQQSSKEMAFELSVVRNFQDSVSSLGSLNSFEDDESEVLPMPRPASVGRRSSMEHSRDPCTPVREPRALRRPVSTDPAAFRKRNYGSFGVRAAAPVVEASKERAETSLRTLLATQQRRSRRVGMNRDGSSSRLLKPEEGLDFGSSNHSTSRPTRGGLDFGSSHHSRFSRRRLLAERSGREDATAATAETSSRALDVESSHSLRQMRFSRHTRTRADSCDSTSQRWASKSIATVSTEESLKIPQRQLSSDASTCKARLSAQGVRLSSGTQDTALSTICQDAIDIVDAYPVNEDSYYSEQDASKDDQYPPKPKRQNTNSSDNATEASSVSADLPRQPQRQVTKQDIPSRPPMDLPNMAPLKKPSRQITNPGMIGNGPLPPMPPMAPLRKPKRQVTNPGMLDEE